MLILSALFDKYKGEYKSKIIVSGVITGIVIAYAWMKYTERGDPVLPITIAGAIVGFIAGCLLAMYLIAGNVLQSMMNAKSKSLGAKFIIYFAAMMYALSLIPIAGVICYIIYLAVR